MWRKTAEIYGLLSFVLFILPGSGSSSGFDVYVFPLSTVSRQFIKLKLCTTAFRIIPECQNNSGIQINIRMIRYDTFIIRTFRVFSGY